MKGTFVLYNEPDAEGRRVIYYRYYLYGSPIKRSTNIKVHPSEWDADAQRITTPGAEHLNRCLERLKRVADDALPSKASPVQVRNMFDLIFERELYRAQHDDFVEYAYEVNLKRLDLGLISKDTYNDNVGRIGVFERYLRQRKGVHFLSLEDVNEDVFIEFISVLKNEKEVIYKGLTPLVAALEYAREEGLIEDSAYIAIKDIHLGVLEKENLRAEKQYLTEEQISTIFRHAQGLPEGRTRDALDIFLFAYFVFGLRMQDIMSLSWDNVSGGTLTKPKYKTSRLESMTFPLSKEALVILDNWKGRPGKYVFGLIPDEAVVYDAVKMKRLRAMRNASIGRIVTSCANELGIKDRITMETARKSFAMMALQKGLPLQQLSRILGHHSVDSTVAYLGLDNISDNNELTKLYENGK